MVCLLFLFNPIKIFKIQSSVLFTTKVTIYFYLTLSLAEPIFILSVKL